MICNLYVFSNILHLRIVNQGDSSGMGYGRNRVYLDNGLVRGRVPALGYLSGPLTKWRVNMFKTTTGSRPWGLALLLIGLFYSGLLSAQCSRIAPAFTNSRSSTCGVPVLITLTNTSTGTSQNVARYQWRLGNTIIRRDTGKRTLVYRITAPGTYTFKLYATDTGRTPCTDSAITTITITRRAPRVKDMNGVFTFSPVFTNCLNIPGTPDTFGVFLEVQDTLKNYTISWGDGNSSTGTQLLSTQKLYKRYNSLGSFTMLVIHTVNGCSDTVRALVVNERTPVAGLVGPPTGTNSGCAPLRVRFINNSNLSSPSTIFIWEWGDGTKDSLGYLTYKDTIYHVYRKKICSGTVKLTMRNTCASSSTTWNPLNVSAKDSAAIDLVNPNNCDLNTSFEFLNKSDARYCLTPNPRKYQWLWGDGTNSGWITTTTSQSKKYNRRGTYNIMLVDSNTCGKDTARYRLVIDSLPTIRSTATPKFGCPPLVVNFDDQSVGNGMSRLWDFGEPSIRAGVNTSTLKSPTYTYRNSGTWRAVLQVSNRCGSVRDTHTIVARKKVKAGFNNFPSVVCKGYSHNFTNTSVEGNISGTTYRWIWEDGTISTTKNPGSRTYNAKGTYTVRLVAYDSCGTDTFSSKLVVADKPTATVTHTPACQGKVTRFSFTTDPTVSWGIWGVDNYVGSNFGYSANPQTIDWRMDTTTNKTVNFVLYLYGGVGGCQDTARFPVVIRANPKVSFTSNGSGCTPFKARFSNTSVHGAGGQLKDMSFKWDFGNASTSIKTNDSTIYIGSNTKDTVYYVKLSGSNIYGCRDSSISTIRVYPKPLSRFNLDKNDGCGPLLISTSNTSIPRDTGSIGIMKFIWRFGNGRTSTTRDTQITYRASRSKDTIYQISLIGVSEHGCLDTSYSNIRVYPKPLSRFTLNINSGCSPSPVVVTNQSIPYDTGSISIMKFNWDFGNKQSSILTNPSGIAYSGQFVHDSVFRISLIAQSEHGCRDTSFRNFTLRPKPTINFGASTVQGCGPLTVKFTNKSVYADNNYWEFDDYGKDTTRNPTKTFFGRDVFDSVVTVKLSAVSRWGCKSDTVRQRITVFGNPISNYIIAKDTFCFPDQMQFLNQSLAAFSYLWNLGDGTITSTTNPKHFFKKGSNPFKDTTYYITLVATSPFGCKDTTRGTMTVLPYPIPRFTIDNGAGCAPHNVKFTNNSVNVRNYFWNFGDGYTSTQTSPSHTFINTGIRDTVYKVILYTYSLDCVDTLSTLINVYKPSVSFFRTDRKDACDQGYFDFKEFTENAPNLMWNFGDGTTSNMRDQAHLFPTSAYRDTSFTVKLYSYSARGCTDSFSRVVTLPQRLQIGMNDTNYQVCAPGTVKFRNFTKGAKTFIWDFGDQGGSSQYSPTYLYQRPGVYGYKLFAFDANGCMDSVISNGRIKVDVSPNAAFAYTPPKPRMPIDNRVYFKDLSTSGIPITYKWDFDDPAGNPPTSTLQNPTHDFSDSGNFRIRLVVDNGGCTDTAWEIVRVEPPFPQPEWIVDRDSGCPPFTVRFTNQSQNSNRYIWFFGDGSRSEEKDPVHVYKWSGYYDVTLIAKGPGGEGVTEKRYHLKALNKPYTYFQLAPSILYLPQANLITKNLTTGSVAYQWDVFKSANGQNVGNSTKVEPYFTLPDTGYYDVRLISVSNQGCYDTLQLPDVVYVNPRGFVYIPDAFTPNRDDRNEVFKPVGLNLQKDFYTFKIYNRWGQLIFESKDPEKGWDGTFNGQLCQSGVYVYKLQAKFYNGDNANYDGIVHLMR